MIREAVILAGGLGTRLQSVLPDLPKCLAPVAERPFLFHVINYWRSQGIERFVFSLGYMRAQIEEYLINQFPTLNYEVVTEDKPLGTGGGLIKALRSCQAKQVLVLNGDTLFRADLHEAARFHEQQAATCTLLLKPLSNFNRYGIVQLGVNGSIKAFIEKKAVEFGLINAGAYLIDKQKLLDEELPEIFSFERDYLEKHVSDRKLMGIGQDVYFRDIGIPADYQLADHELRSLPLHPKRIDDTWTVFLDRDGVINHEAPGNYIRTVHEFKFYTGVPESLARLSKRVGRLIIVTNQRGVGKGLMTESDLRDINQYMLNEIKSAGGHIDRIYYCTQTNNLHPDRKPNPGMAYRARQEFPDIDPAKTLMLGNKHSDMLFARNAGFYACYISTTNPELDFPHPDVDKRFEGIPQFTDWLLCDSIE